jgi:predicted PhzF superfamily epimerase YddE/YHI9
VTPELSYRRYDSFAAAPLAGNPAAVLLLDDWPADERLAAIAGELNHWTAFARRDGDAWQVRIFTIPPIVETALCGHGLLATARRLFDGPAECADRVVLRTRDGEVPARPIDGGAEIDFPAIPVEPVIRPPHFAGALTAAPLRWWKRKEGYPAWLALYATPAQVATLDPRPLAGTEALVLATAPGSQADFVSRLFQPMKSLLEDPAGGTQHAIAGPFWAGRLGRSSLRAESLSPRGGQCELQIEGERVKIAAPVAFAGEGTLRLP